MKNAMKSMAVLIAWAHLFACVTYNSPCYGIDSEDNEKKVPSRILPLLPNDSLPEQQSSWRPKTVFWDLPVLFVATLVTPTNNLEDAQQFCKAQRKKTFETFQEQLAQVKKKGVLGYTGEKVSILLEGIKDHPLDAVVYSGAVLLGWTDVEKSLPVLPLVITTVSNFKLSKDLKVFASSITGETLPTKVMKMLVGGTAIYMVASVPVGAALEWNNYAAAKAHYSGGPCPQDPWDTIMTPASACLEEGGSLNECRILIPAGKTVGNDLYIFTRHPTTSEGLDPVSVVKLHEEGKTCFHTALTSKSPVTETCFEQLNNPSTRTVRALSDMTLAQAHEGLNAGQSMRHIGLHLNDKSGCGTFNEASAQYGLGEEPICLLTALKSGGDVTQMCFNPNQPESLILKKNNDVSLTFDSNDPRPVSIVIKRPKEIGLDVGPDIPSPASISTPPPLCDNKVEVPSLWEYLKLWWSGKPPCPKDEL